MLIFLTWNVRPIKPEYQGQNLYLWRIYSMMKNCFGEFFWGFFIKKVFEFSLFKWKKFRSQWREILNFGLFSLFLGVSGGIIFNFNSPFVSPILFFSPLILKNTEEDFLKSFFPKQGRRYRGFSLTNFLNETQ